MAVRGENSLFFASGIDNSGLRKGTAEATGLVDKMGKDIEKSDPYKTLDEGFDTKEVDKGAKETVSIIDRLKERLSGINPFAVLAAGASAAFTKIAMDSFKMMQEFEANMKEVQTISQATQEDFEGMSKAVFQLSTISTDTPAQLAQAFYAIVGAGHDGATGLELLEVAAKAAIAGVTDTMTAADGLTTVINAFGLEASEAESVADALFTTVKLGKTTFEELSSTFAQVAPLAASTGFSFQEVLAAVASLTKQGTPTAQAMTQIRAAIQATSKVLGDGAAHAMTLQNAFQAVADEAGGSQNKLTTMAGSVEAVGAILALTGKNAEGARRDLEALGDSAGASGVAFRRNAEANTNQWEIFGNRVNDVTKEIGSVILQMSNDVVGALNKTLESSEDARKAFEEQKLELFRLEGALHNVTEGSEDYNAIRDEILRNYPDFLSGIDSETVTTQQLLSVLNQVNEAYVQRFKFAQREAELREAYERQGMLEISIEDVTEEFRETIAKIRASTGIELDLTLNDEELYQQVKELTDDMVGFTGQRTEGQQVLAGQIMRLNDLIGKRQEYNEELEDQIQLIDEIAERNQRYSRAELETEAGRLEAIRKINEATRESELSQFVDSGVEEIERALQARRDILSNLRKIDQTQSLEELKSYLESENEEVAKYAQERRRILNTSVEGGTGTTGGDGGGKSFAEILKDRERQYQEYTAAVNQLGKDQADEMYQELLKQGDNYGDYLQRQLNQTSDAAKRTAIAVAAELNKINLRRGDVSSVNELTAQGIVDFEVNDTSINYIERQISRLREQWKAASEEERPDIEPQLKYWEERLREAERGTETEENLYSDVTLTLSDLNLEQLRKYKEYWERRLETAVSGSEEEMAIQNRIAAAQNKIIEVQVREGSKMLREVSRMFRENGSEEIAEFIDKLETLGSSIGNTVGVLNDSTSSSLEKATSIVGLFTTAYTILKQITDHLNRDKNLERQKEVNQGLLDQMNIEEAINAIRRERLELMRRESVLLATSYKQVYSDALEQQQEAQRIMEESINALASGGLLQGEGSTSGFFGIGSKTKRHDFSISDILNSLLGQDIPYGMGDGTRFDAFMDAENRVVNILENMGKTAADAANFSSQEWLDFFRIAEEAGYLADETTRGLFENAKEAVDRYNESLETMRGVISDVAGSLGNDLKNALTSAFSAGEDAAISFRDSISNIMQDLFMEELINNQFRSFFEQLQSDMEDSFGAGGDGSWIDDIDRFSDLIEPKLQGAMDAMRAFDEFLASQGYEGFDRSERQGLSGAISSITEDTANILAGTLNAILLDIRQGLDIAIENSQYLSEIASNTRYNRYLESMDNRLATIERGVNEFQAQG